MVKYIKTTEVAKLIRIELKKKFPNTIFSVRSESYSGGSSIDVKWTDGPSIPKINKIIKKFEGSGFDGMTDYKYNRPPIKYKGEMVNWGVDFVFAKRNYTEKNYIATANEIGRRYGIKKRFKNVNEIMSYNKMIGSYWFNDAVYQRWYKRSFK
ncbi:MAG: LPD29 domain-containing protein [bacterium]